MSSTAAVTPIHPLLLNDEIFAWQLCSQEVQDTTHSISKKNSLTNEPDLEVALDFYLEEIQARLEFLNDMKLAHDIASADEADFVAIAEAASKEVHVREDQNYAFRISNEDQTLEAPIVSNSDDKLRVLEEETFHKLASLLADDQDENYTESECEAGPSVPYVQRQEKALQDAQKKACVSCMDNFDEESMMKLDCGDQYCHRCLKRVIMSAINSRNLNLLPPRCHRIPIPATIITEILTDEDLRRFERAKAEKYSKIKIYCTAVDCGEFIDSSLIKGITATCPRCNEKTCVRCKAPSHEGECAPDEDVRPTFVLGGDKNWQRCYSCSRLVEKMGFGCNHMTCWCGAEFCYVCGAEWVPRHCDCALLDEADIIERIGEVVDRDVPRNINPAERRQMVDQVRGDIWNWAQDECEHPGHFRRITDYMPRRGFRCELCNERKWRYILQCRHCHLNVCEDCRRHRI